MNIYYYSHQVYQLSFAIQLYKQLGGFFLVRKLNRKLRLKWYCRKRQRKNAIDSIFEKTPKVVLINIKKITGLKGVIISYSNTPIQCLDNGCIKIFMGHGSGDKKYGGSVKTLTTYDFHFISGKKHMAKLDDCGIHIPAEKLIKIGNPRFDELINGDIDKGQYLKYLGVKDLTRKIILYAPTWKWGNGTLHLYFKDFSRQLSKDYSLIIRPHYFDRKYIPKMKRWLTKREIDNVYISNPANILTNDTMYDIAVSDILISDTSSITYEYLITQNPIVILNNNYTDLHEMPSSLDIKTIATIYNESSSISDFVSNTLENHNPESYKSMLDDCFYFNDGQSTKRITEFLQSV